MLYLVQHGLSLAKDVDLERSLSEEGVAETEKIAARAAKQGLAVSTIKHSGKKRARQTAEIFGAMLRPPNGIEETGGLAPLDEVASLAGDLQAKANLMLVGHLPFLEKLVSSLILGCSSPKPVVKFQNSGIVCLDQDPATGGWFLRWTLVPRLVNR